MISMPRFDSWMIVAHPKFIDELNRAPDDVLSFMDAASEVKLRICFVLSFTYLSHKAYSNALHLWTETGG